MNVPKKVPKSLQELIDEADDVFARITGRKESISLYEEALKIAKEAQKQLETEYIQGKTDLIDENWEDALDHFDRVIRLDSKFFKAWHYKGFVLHELGRYEEALACYNKVLEINSRFEPAWSNKGNSLYELGRYEEALACCDKALEINSRFELAWNNKGNSLYGLGRYKESLECYEKALEINSKLETSKLNRNLALMHLGRVDEALKEIEKISSEKKEEIEKSESSKEEKEERFLEIDAQDEVIHELRDEYKEIIEAKTAYDKRLADSLKPRDEPLKDNFFLVLRRWNSYTPTMLTPTESNLGGGYFLHWKGKGIVIDPGFNFLDNFFNNELVIYDIDTVIITHAHVDHCSDFESLLTLIFEYNEKNEKKKKIDVYMNLGVLKKFLGWIPIDEDEKNAKINRIIPVEKEKTYDLGDYITLRVTKAIHDEVLCKAYSVGLILELYGESDYTESKPFRIGFTSDTRHDKHVEEQYKDVDIIVPHLGSIDKNDFKPGDDDVKRNKNHLMLTGVNSTIYKSNAKLAIISEFGEELGEHRLTIISALNKVFRKNNMARCLTGDIGLKVKIPDLKVKCHYCKKCLDANNMLEAIDPENEDKKCIVYYCKDCENIYEHEKEKPFNESTRISK
ncbi:MAG: tetratricopeptide repeat protein [Proteobacteria bacterium]|jgi:tetratricopeptide (TPR) repeat protein|nr:tetratricopeptide repeat protein [Pseudomonadota bacterium]